MPTLNNEFFFCNCILLWLYWYDRCHIWIFCMYFYYDFSGLEKILHNSQNTIHLRRPWTRAFFRPTSRTVAFSLRLKNSGHVTIFFVALQFQPKWHHVINVLQTAGPQKCYRVTRIFEPRTKTNGPWSGPEKSACPRTSETDSIHVYCMLNHSMGCTYSLWIETSDVPPPSMANCRQDCVMTEVIVYYVFVLVYRLYWSFVLKDFLNQLHSDADNKQKIYIIMFEGVENVRKRSHS